jgi:hypothetical protein
MHPIIPLGFLHSASRRVMYLEHHADVHPFCFSLCDRPPPETLRPPRNPSLPVLELPYSPTTSCAVQRVALSSSRPISFLIYTYPQPVGHPQFLLSFERNLRHSPHNPQRMVSRTFRNDVLPRNSCPLPRTVIHKKRLPSSSLSSFMHLSSPPCSASHYRFSSPSLFHLLGLPVYALTWTRRKTCLVVPCMIEVSSYYSFNFPLVALHDET